MKPKLPLVHSYVEIGSGQLPIISSAISTGKDAPRQRVGTLGFVNLNGAEVAVGALDEWLNDNDRVPMYAEHNNTTIPGGYWADMELTNGRELYARPVVTPETTLGADINAALKAGTIKGISWTVGAKTYDDYDFRDREEGETGYYGGDEVLVVGRGNLLEVSVVYYPADTAAGFYDSDEDDEKPRNSIESMFVHLVERDHTAASARRMVIDQLFKKE